eukprot:GILK01001738.1.p1 GENE.GILK01001738.1~~GILK01001738.1.p1  ORF type:complete len:553 (-),score=117.16 GILK01001738.1:254-1912(-)
MAIGREEERKKSFKKTLDLEDARRKREEETISLRKNKREESIQKRRQLIVEDESATAQQSAPSLASRVERIPELAVNLRATDADTVIAATSEFRKLLSSEHNPPIQQVIEAQVVPRFVEFLQPPFDGYPKLQLEAAWALTNIASGSTEQTAHAVQMGAIPSFIRLLHSHDDETREQAVWGLGNIAGDNTNFRDAIIHAGAVQALTQILASQSKLSMMRNAIWTLSNLCRGKPQPELSLIKPAVPVIANVVCTQGDNEVLTDALWALSYISDGHNDRIEAVIEMGDGLINKIVEMLTHSNPGVITPALRCVGNIVTGTDDQTQAMIDANVLSKLNVLLSNPKKNLRKEACWAISNITAGSKAQIQAAINAGVFPSIVSLLRNGEFDVKKEACYAVCNATTGGGDKQMQYLVKQGVVAALSDVLSFPQPELVLVSLSGLENILKVGASLSKNDNNYFWSHFEECEGIDKIENLQNHENEEIYNKVVEIIETYFGVDEEADDSENVNPNTTTTVSKGFAPVAQCGGNNGAGQFNFGMNFAAPTPLQSNGFQFQFN